MANDDKLSSLCDILLALQKIKTRKNGGKYRKVLAKLFTGKLGQRKVLAKPFTGKLGQRYVTKMCCSFPSELES